LRGVTANSGKRSIYWSDESLPSWFERVCHEYAMSPPLLLGVLEREAYGKTATPGTRDADRLLDSAVADRIAVLGQLSDFEINTLSHVSSNRSLWSHAKLKNALRVVQQVQAMTDPTSKVVIPSTR
jgi:hypothetical protein